MKTKLYLDTSIPSAYYDTSKPVRQLMTQKWFENDAASYELYISILTIEELNNLKNSEKLRQINDLLAGFDIKVLQISEKAIELGKEYIKKGDPTF
jgi:predicted nucleic acid-binding protein